MQALSDTKGSQLDDGDTNSPLTFPCPTCKAVITVPPGGVIQFQISLKAKGSEDGNKQIKFTSTFPCPSCKAVIPVPAGGVAELQDNFDLNHEPLTCKVCDQPWKAVYICIDCCHTMCAQCQRCHEKFTSNHRIQPLTSRCIQSSRNTSLPKSVEAITDHLTVLEAALVTMREEEDTLQREMLTVADVISRRADVMRALVTQAERNSQRALAELTNRLGKQIQEEMVSAREKQTVILQLLEHSSTGRQSPVSSNEILIRFLLKKEDYQYYRQRNKSKRLKFLIPQFIDSAIDEQDISSYIGTWHSAGSSKSRNKCSKGYRRKGSHQLLRMTRKPLSVPSLPYQEKLAYS